jgi:AcrR family transcriptional regulator
MLKSEGNLLMSAAVQQNSSLSSLSPVQAQVIQVLAKGSTVTAAANAAGIHRTTIHHWLRTQKEFAAALEQAHEEYVEQLRDELQELSGLALSKMRELLDDPNTPASVRLRAALAVLQRPSFPKAPWALPESIESSEHDDFVRRMQYLKADYEMVRAEEALRSAAKERSSAELTPRGAPCPCGSGNKYKRCCGTGAPPALRP